MPKNNLTEGTIEKLEKNVDLKVDLSFINEIDFEKYPYTLIIKSKTKRCFRITLYPLEKNEIVKLSLNGENISDNILEKLSQILHRYEIIHTSGLLVKKKQLFYECYLNMTKNSEEFVRLTQKLEEIRSVFNSLEITQILVNE